MTGPHISWAELYKIKMVEPLFMTTREHRDKALGEAGYNTFRPHMEQIAFPAQALSAELYPDAGVRTMERGIVSAGRDKKTGDHCFPELELVRLTIPRRVYTQAHRDVIAESVVRVHERCKEIKGLRMTYEPKYLRFFQAKYEKL